MRGGALPPSHLPGPTGSVHGRPHVTYRQHNPRGPPGVPLRGEPAGTAMKGQGARGGSGHSEGRTLRHSGRMAKPRGQQGRGSQHRMRRNDGKDQSRGSRQPHPGQRKTPGQDGPSPVSLTPGPLAREWWGGVLPGTAQPWAGLAVSCWGWLSWRSWWASEQGQQSPVWGLPGGG